MVVNHLEIVDSGRDMFTIKNSVTKKYVKMGMRETKYLFDCLGCNHEFDFSPVEELSQDNKSVIYQKFEEWGFFDTEKEFVSDPKKFDFTKIKICELNPEQTLSKIPKWIQEMFSWKGALALAIMTVLSLRMLCRNTDVLIEFTQNLFHLSIHDYIIFYFMMIVTTMLHEFGHALCCYRNGGKVSSMGMMLFFLVPCFFCDVSDIYMFKNRKKSFGVAIAGVSVNYACALISCILYFVLYHFGIDIKLLLFYNFANIGFVVFNLIPFVKLDGYWTVTSLLEIDNLMDKSILTFLAGVINPAEYKEIPCPKKKKCVLTLYGLIAILFRPIFWVISASSAVNFLKDRHLDFLSGFVVGFVLIMVVKDIATLLKRYYEMYNNQKNRIFRMI